MTRLRAAAVRACCAIGWHTYATHLAREGVTVRACRHCGRPA